MNGLAPYAAFFMRLAVGGVFLRHGITKFQDGIPAVAGFLHGVGVPFASVGAVIIIAVETVGAAVLLLRAPGPPFARWGRKVTGQAVRLTAGLPREGAGFLLDSGGLPSPVSSKEGHV